MDLGQTLPVERRAAERAIRAGPWAESQQAETRADTQSAAQTQPGRKTKKIPTPNQSTRIERTETTAKLKRELTQPEG